jgi:chemotaxis protein histidine kinase CheA
VQPENDYSSALDTGIPKDRDTPAADDQQERSVEWLLEQDYSDPTEKLFTLAVDDYSESELSVYEENVANRPMFGGDAHADDLSSFIEEEIVLTESGQGADIYALSGLEKGANTGASVSTESASMAIDHTRSQLRDIEIVNVVVEEGLDILGLAAEDNIGEHFVVLQKLGPATLEKQVTIATTLIEPGESQATEDDNSSEPIAPSDDVFDYVAANEPPRDDNKFDQYLLGGEHFSQGNPRVDDLTIERTEGVPSVDPLINSAIDYHEDFTASDSFNSESVSAIAKTIAAVMEEMTASVSARLKALGLDADSAWVELSLGNNTDSIAQCRRENYLPILEVAAEVPPALASLGQTEIDSIYLRISSLHDEQNWNELFTEGFAVAKEELVDESESIGFEFEDSLFDIDISDDFTAELDPEVEAESSTIEGLTLGTGMPEEDVFDVEIARSLTVASAAFEPSPDMEITALTGTEAEPIELAADTVIFDEDIFSSDLSDDLEDIESSSAVDLEALIDSLADSEVDIGEICGIAVDEFSHDDAETLSAAETAASRPTPAPEIEQVPQIAVESVAAASSWCVPPDIKFSYTSKSVSQVFADFLDAFIEEGASELEKLEDAIGEWEKNITSEDAYEPIPRVLHTLKGIAKSVGLQRYGTLIHNFETLLDALPRPKAGGEQIYFQIINAWLDAAVRGFEQVEKERGDIASELPLDSVIPVSDQGLATPPIAESEVVGELDPEVKVSGNRRFADEDRRKDKQLADEGAKVLAAQQTIRMTPEAVDRLLSLTNEAQQLGVRSSQSTVRGKRAAAELLARLSLVRAHVSKIADRALLNVTAKGTQAGTSMDALEMDQYSELQEAANILREGVEDLDDLIRVSSRQNAIAEALLKQQASVISSMGSAIQATRVVPVSRLMPGLRRIVRNLGSDLGKAVSFKVINEVGTLDRDNHARCQIILEHMIRNALDHGIEKPQDRVAAGKSPTGSITIDASKSGSDYIICLSDDGKGIDPEVMRDTAHEKGLSIDVDMLSDLEATRLIFHKGFSTASAVSEVSGRGVGMDIVLSELQQIGGDIEIESEVGVGTTFRVRIPSNVTVNGALLVAAGEVSYAIPLDGLIAVEHVPVSVFYDAIESGGRLNLFGMDCEPAYLATICHGDNLPERGAFGPTIPVIIAGTEERYMAIAIDDVTQALELVIRSLGVQFSTIPGLTGGATTADGQSIVALDLNALVASVASDHQAPVSLHTDREERMLVLVVDDSRTQRMVATSQFDTLGVETVTAENGLVAIELLNSTHRLPDVVLLDIEMPVKDGIQTLREIRKSIRYSHLPVIMVTSRTGAKHRALAEAAGCNGYMGKPFNFPKLIEQIATLTQHKFQLS